MTSLPLIEILHTKTNKHNVKHELERFGRSYYVLTVMPLGSVKERAYSDYRTAKAQWDSLS